MTHEKLDKADFNKLMGKDKTPDTNQNHIIIGFFEFDFSPDIFTKDLGLQPLHKGVNGEKYLTGSKKNVEKVHKCNMWTYEYKTYSNDFIGELIAKFIDEILKPRVDSIKRLTKNCEVQFRIVQYYYGGCNPGIYIESDHNKILADINASIDLDLYCLGD